MVAGLAQRGGGEWAGMGGLEAWFWQGSLRGMDRGVDGRQNEKV